MPLILSGSAGLSGNVGNVTKDMLPAGSLLQVVQVLPAQLALSAPASGASNVNAANMTLANTILAFSGTLVPKDANSKILVQLKLCTDGGSVNAEEYVLIFKGSSILASNLWYRRVAGHEPQTHVINYLDSPATTNAVQYDIRIGSGSGHVVYINRNSSNTAANTWNNSSSLILMEIKG